jgi:hypothetical protein
MEYNFQKSRVTGPWDHRDSVSAKKVKKKFHACVPLNLFSPLIEKILTSAYLHWARVGVEIFKWERWKPFFFMLFFREEKLVFFSLKKPPPSTGIFGYANFVDQH